MQDSVNAVGAQDFHHEVAIADFANDERGIEHSLPEARGQIVQHHHLITSGFELQYGVASDITGAAGDQD
jgi:hypothetical protein